MNHTDMKGSEIKLVGPHQVSQGGADHQEDHDNGHALNWRDINRVLFVAAAAAVAWFIGGTGNPYITAIGVICTVIGGFPIFHEAYENITQHRMTMELSMAIAIVAALAQARAAVQESPRSAAAWGRLGMVLAAHDFRAEANACLAQAERLDPLD